ncbi:MAG: carbohydrate ABC transporter permease, partial [Acutalibacter sp.]
MESKETQQKQQNAMRKRENLRTALTYLLLSIWAVVVLFPFYWMVLTSFKSYSSYNGERTPVFITLSPTLENYENAFTAVPLLGYLLNTLIFALATTAIMVVVSTLAAYAFARLKFRGKNLVFGLFLSMMMIPTELVVITNFVTITNLDLRNSFLGLILPSITSVFYIYLLKENFEQVPEELYKAAKVDGTSDLKYLWKVMIPI